MMKKLFVLLMISVSFSSVQARADALQCELKERIVPQEITRTECATVLIRLNPSSPDCTKDLNENTVIAEHFDIFFEGKTFPSTRCRVYSSASRCDSNGNCDASTGAP